VIPTIFRAVNISNIKRAAGIEGGEGGDRGMVGSTFKSRKRGRGGGRKKESERICAT